MPTINCGREVIMRWESEPSEPSEPTPDDGGDGDDTGTEE